MKLARALFLSSQKQAESWEWCRLGLFTCQRTYRFLVIDEQPDRLRFQIFCVQQEGLISSSPYTVSEHPHVDETFADLGVLHNFLHRFQIDLESWSPVEPE